jgi:hypothetical protein
MIELKKSDDRSEDKIHLPAEFADFRADRLIGYLRADMDTDGNGFFSSWNDWRKI